MRRAPARPVRACFVRSCCSVVVQENMTCTRPRRNATPSKHFPHTSHCTLHTSHLHFTLALHLNSSHLGSSHLIPCLAQNTFQYYFVLQSLHKVFPNTTLYYKACTNYFPVLMSSTKACTNYFAVLLCTTKLAHTTSQYYFVLQSLRKALPSTTLYYKACRKHFPVLLCTTKLAESTSQYYFVLQSLHKALPSTTLYYKACKALPSTTLYYKAGPSTTLYFKACTKHVPSITFYYKSCTKHVPVLLCTSKLAQSTFQYYFVLQSLHKARPSWKSAAKSLSQPWCSHSNTIYKIQPCHW